jgi:anti-sigma B factor antagonist
MTNPFSIEVSHDDALSIIRLQGYVDAYTAPQFEAAVQAEVDAGHNRLIIDGDGLNYISSAGLGVFMSFLEEVRGSGGDIKICNLQSKVRHTFEILGFHEIFEIVESEAAARNQFGNV